jgi:betaine-aldehyde dehydrogenase
VVAKIIPFNQFAAGKIAAPLAAGNSVIVKPPEQAPLSTLRFAELIDGLLPSGVFNVATGGREAGQALTAHRDIAMLSVIGSVATGRAVMRAAANGIRPVPFKPCFGLGGPRIQERGEQQCADPDPGW